MHIKKIYTTGEMMRWTRFETLTFVVIITLWVALYHFLDLKWIKIPWTPLAVIGTAVAFVIGFQNNSAYGRIWEARKIWGGIVNTSRTLGMYAQDMLSNEHAKTPLPDAALKEEIRVITYRHIAWMTALRHAMRSDRPWETTSKHKTNQEWNLVPPERLISVEEDLKPYLSKEDLAYVMDKDNKQTALLYLQSHHLRKLKEQGIVWEFSFLQMEGVLEELFTLQGKSERIKNFPYPRQFATLNHFFMWIFVLLMPLALIPQFAEIGLGFEHAHPIVGKYFIWLSIPFYSIIAWVFHTMERIGRTGENPFEGTANDVPISTIARGIEIDLRQNLGEDKASIPKQFEVKLHTQF